MTATLTPDDPLSDSERLVDERSRQFEAAWRDETPPRLEDFLNDVPETVRTDVLRTLLKLEIDYRTRAGQPTDPAELRSRVAALGPWASSVLDGLGNGPTLILEVMEGNHTGEQFRAAPPLTLVVGRSDGDHFAL